MTQTGVRIEIQSTNVREGGFTDKRTGEYHPIYEQTAYLHQGGKPYPTEFRLTLARDRKGQPYEPGFYALHPDSFYVDQRKFSKLACSPVLAPVK